MLTVSNHIDVDEKGVARIAGTRFKARLLIADAQFHGWGVSELHEQFPQLNLAQLYAAFVYYHDHKEEIDRQIADADAYVKETRAKYGKNQPTLEELRSG